jgi:hypothetical protein
MKIRGRKVLNPLKDKRWGRLNWSLKIPYPVSIRPVMMTAMVRAMERPEITRNRV